MFNDHLKKFLKLYDCNNTELFDLILNCKKELKNELFDIYKQDVFIEPIKLETSIKIMNSGKSIKSRYVIGIHINEFKLYNENNKYKIFNLLGFDFENFKDIIKNVDENCQMYLGLDNKKGKIYFDGKNIHTGYESSGLIKYYNSEGSDTFKITTSKSGNDVVSIQKRINDNENKYWYAISNEYKTYYYRPNIYFDEIEIKKYTDNIQKEYKILKNWYEHKCMCCSKKS